MPRLSRLMIRTALVWLALGYTIGGLLLLNKGVPMLPWLWTLRYTHVHLLLIGWNVQFACGVAFWILPRLDASGARGSSDWPTRSGVKTRSITASTPQTVSPLQRTVAEASPAPSRPSSVNSRTRTNCDSQCLPKAEIIRYAGLSGMQTGCVSMAAIFMIHATNRRTTLAVIVETDGSTSMLAVQAIDPAENAAPPPEACR